MRSNVNTIVVLAGLALLVACAMWQSRLQLARTGDTAANTLPAPRYDIPRHVRYGFTLRNTTNQVLEDVEFWTYAPVRQTSTQLCCEQLESSLPHTLEVDGLGNQVMHFEIPELGPYASEVLQINADLSLAEIPNQISVTDLAGYLAEERFVEVSDPKIKRLAARIPGPDAPHIARGAFDLAHGSLRYAGYVRKDQGARHALETGKGDCTEFMYLFMALARARGVPARGIGGYVNERDAVLRSSDYHNWAEFYADGTWQIADAQKGVFQPERPRYIAMQVLGEPESGAISNAHRFWHNGKGLEVRMN